MSARYVHDSYIRDTSSASLRERVEHFLKIHETQQSLNAFLEIYPEAALQQAETIDRRRSSGEPLGALAGVVLGLKDNICVRGRHSSCASRILESFVSPYNATVVERILAADGIILGRTNMDEFAMGSSNENSAFGPVLNPHDVSRVSGGSSGGSCAAVAAGLVDMALGSDTGGSIRQPASFCGVVGMKPAYGRVSRYGLVAFASSLDQIGPIANSVEDAAMLLQVIAGGDPRDATSVQEEVPDYSVALQSVRTAPLRIGIPREFYQEGLDPLIAAEMEKLQQQLRDKGHQLVDIDLPLTEYAIAVYYIIATAEASSNLSRFDGVRYGHRAAGAEDLQTMYERSRSEGFGEEVKRRIMLGTYVLSSGYYDAYYRKAQQVRRLIQQEYTRAFQHVDVLLTPTTPTGAFALGEKSADPLQMYLSDIYTVTANLAGICAISLPLKMPAGSLPAGVQLLGAAFREDLLLQAAALVEKCSA